MPLYEYECESCGATFEVIQKFSDHSVDTCRTCGGKVRRLLSAPAIQFKGTGWYITDYARKGKDGRHGLVAGEVGSAVVRQRGSSAASSKPRRPSASGRTSASPASTHGLDAVLVDAGSDKK